MSCEDGTVTSIPEVSRFFEMVTRIHTDDHDAPRIHARYGEAEAAVGIRYFGLLYGRLPPRALGLMVEGMALHQGELLAAWHRAWRGEGPGNIPPLD